MTTHRGDWQQTHGGRAIYPLDPRPEDIHLSDIAASLSKICRYAGGTHGFYSVAEHSVILSYAVPSEHAAWALLHDAAEMCIGDIPRPVKHAIPGIKAIEDRILHAVAARFGLTWPIPAVVKEFDARILLNEQRVFMPNPPMPWGVPGDPLPGITFEGLAPNVAEYDFLSRAAELGIEAVDNAARD